MNWPFGKKYFSKLLGNMVTKEYGEFQSAPRDLYNQIWYALTGFNYYKPTDNLDSFIEEGYFNDVVSASIDVLIARAIIPKLKLFEGKGEDKEEILEHPLLDLMESPNSRDNYEDIISQWMIYKKVCGFAPFYGFKPSVGINPGIVNKLYVLPSQRLEAVASGNFIDPIDHYICDVIIDTKIPTQDIMISRYFDPRTCSDAENIIFGRSPLKAAWLQIAKHNAANETEYKQFADGMVKTLLGSDTSVNLTKEQKEELDKKLKSEAKKKKGLLPSFINIPLKAITVGSTVKDLMTNESLNASKQSISAALGVPSRIINDPNGSTYSNRKEDEKSIWANGLKRDLDSLAKDFTRFLCKTVPGYEGLYFEYDYSGIDALQDDMKEKVEWMTKAYYTPNEVRVETGMEPIDDEIMNQPIFSNSVTPLSELPFSVNIPQEPA